MQYYAWYVTMGTAETGTSRLVDTWKSACDLADAMQRVDTARVVGVARDIRPEPESDNEDEAVENYLAR